MEGNLKISVVLPVYNCEKYLARSIESVTRQTYDNWELIIVNDGSQDSSHQIAYESAGKDNRIHLIDKKNEGVSVARNKGMEAVTGDILMFLDADDWFDENAFEEVVTNWDNSMQMLLFDYYDVAGTGKKQYRKHFKENKIEFGVDKKYSIDYLELTISGFYRQQNIRTVIQAPWGRAFSVSYLKKMQIKFPVGVFNGEDQVFNLRAVDKMRQVLYMAKPIYCYYINLESVTFAAYRKNGEKILYNIAERNNCVRDIFFSKTDNMTYKNAYYSYLYDGIKVVLWWLAEEHDKNKKKLGEEFCRIQAKEIREHLDGNYSISDRILIRLCEMKCFGIIEKVVKLWKQSKRKLNIR